MILSSIEFESYKSFAEKQLFVIKPITIIIGKNSSGKSALSRVPLLLANSFAQDAEEPVTMMHDGVEFGGSFMDLIHNRMPHGSLKMAMNFDNGTQISFDVQNINGQPIQIVKKWCIRSAILNLDLDIVLNDENVQRTKDVEYTSEGKRCVLTFEGLIPVAINIDGEQLDERILDLLAGQLHFFSKSVEYVGPYRQIPQRVYFHSGKLPSRLGNKGENTPQLLGTSSIRKAELVKATGDWYQKNLGGWRVEVEQVEEFFQVVLVSPDDASVKVNIVDVGQGMSQVLPLVVRCYLRNRAPGAISIIEQPELHLHPAAHGELAELFAVSAKSEGARYILETHSENIILRIRRLVVQGMLTKDDVVIYWVDDEERPGSKIKEITIDEYGDISEWPKGIFSEDYEEVLAIREAQKKRKQ